MMLKSGWLLLTETGFAADTGRTVWRVLGGFMLAALLALPLGALMGAYKPVEAVFEPFVSFARYLPASAFIPCGWRYGRRRRRWRQRPAAEARGHAAARAAARPCTVVGDGRPFMLWADVALRAAWGVSGLCGLHPHARQEIP